MKNQHFPDLDNYSHVTKSRKSYVLFLIACIVLCCLLSLHNVIEAFPIWIVFENINQNNILWNIYMFNFQVLLLNRWMIFGEWYTRNQSGSLSWFPTSLKLWERYGKACLSFFTFFWSLKQDLLHTHNKPTSIPKK